MAAESLSGFGSYDGTNWQVTALGSGISYDGLSFDSISFSAENQNGLIQVPYLSGAGAEGFFTGNGYYSDEGMNFDVEVSDMDVSHLSSFAGVDLGAGYGPRPMSPALWIIRKVLLISGVETDM